MLARKLRQGITMYSTRVENCSVDEDDGGVIPIAFGRTGVFLTYSLSIRELNLVVDMSLDSDISGQRVKQAHVAEIIWESFVIVIGGVDGVRGPCVPITVVPSKAKEVGRENVAHFEEESFW